MDSYLAKFGITYTEWIRIHNTKIPPDKMRRPYNVDYQRQYWRGREIPDDKKSLLCVEDYRERYCRGHEIPDDKKSLLRVGDYRRRYAHGCAIPDKIKCPIYDSTYRHRYLRGYIIPDYKMHLIRDEDYQRRCQLGFDPECRPYKLSYLLGYRVPDNIKLELTPRDCAIHSNFALNEAYILALAGLVSVPFAIPREFAADFEYVMSLTSDEVETGKKVPEWPEWLELRMPTGEVAFRTEDSANCPAAGAMIDQVCDGLCSPKWGARRVGEMCGAICLAPVSAT